MAVITAFVAAIILARLSFRVGRGDYEHNLRLKHVEHADPARLIDNIVFIRMTLEQAYQRVFGKAERIYETKLGMDQGSYSYLEQRKGYKRPNLSSELLVMIGNKFNCGVGTEGWKRAREVLMEYMLDFQKRNPNLYVYCAALHLDEQTPHLHIMVIPYADGYKSGPLRQLSFAGALEAQGFNKDFFQMSRWKDSERAVLEELMLKHGMERAVDLGLRRAHLTIEMYKAYMENLDNRIRELPALIRRLREERGEITVKKEELDNLELRAQISPIYAETAQKVIAEAEKEKKNCLKYQKYLEAEFEKILTKQAEMAAVENKLANLEEENVLLRQKLETLNRRCNRYSDECDAEREHTSIAKKERDASNKALVEVTKAVSMLIDPMACGYEIQNLDMHSRNVLQAIARRGKRALKEAGIELDTSMDGNVYDIRLPDGVRRELYMMNEQEEDLEL